MYSTLSTIRCERCGREASAIFACPERKHGGCPFVERWKARKWKALVILLILGAFIGLQSQSWWPLVGAAAIGPLLAWSFLEAQLHHAGKGIVLERTTFAGLKLSLRTKMKCQELPVCAQLPRAIKYPLSIVMLLGPCRIGEENHRAACILRAALMDLQLKQLIQLRMLLCDDPARMEMAAKHRTECYVTRVPQRPAGTFDLGDIEQGLLRAVEGWKPAPVDRNGWLEGPSLYELIRAYYGENRAEPAGDVWRSAKENAWRCGLWRVTASNSLWQPRQDVREEDLAADLQSDCRASEEMLSRFAKTYPDLWSGMEIEITDAIKSRIESSD